jgi:glycosyltransferase involved in cell wall biosynthesis
MKKKLAILVNIIAPARVPIFINLLQCFDTLVLHGGAEPNRTWTVNTPHELKTHKVFTIQIPMRKRSGVRGVSDTVYVHLNFGIAWALLRFKPDVIISYEMGFRTAFAILYGKLARVPVWVWWGGTVHSEQNISRLRKLFRRVIVRHVSRWISYGVTTTEYLETIGISRGQILQIQNCVPQETFLAVPSHPIEWFKDDPRPVFLSVGQLVKRKGFDKLIQACGRLARRGREFTLVLVGDGPERDRLVEMARENHIKHFRIFPGKSQPALNEIYRAADVFVFPTLEDVWGLVVNEAMWAGVPVLCSKYAGCAPELVPEMNIFDPLSKESFDAALERVFEKSIYPSDRSKLRTWQEVSELVARSLVNGSPIV